MNTFNSQFANALLSPDAPVPTGIVDYEGDVSEKRFAVYRNNVTVSLIEALKASFPTILNLVGEEFFIHLAKIYVGLYPPKSRLLYLYGDKFSHFLAEFEPLSKYPYMADVAALEYERVQAYHKEDAKAVTAEDLLGIPQEAFGELTFQKHPACKIIRSIWPILSILVANTQEDEEAATSMAAVNLNKMEDVLIVRPQYQVDIYSLFPGEYTFFKALFNGHSLDKAAEIVHARVEEFDLQNALTKALSLGIFSAIVQN